MNTHGNKSQPSDKLTISPKSLAKPAHQRGQAMVEFTLIFILLLVVAWIPADFGLAFYTGQIAQNAAREGARIAAADRTLTPGSTKCQMPCSGATGILKATADRMSSALLPGAWVTLTVGNETDCTAKVTVNITGRYNFSFYYVLRLLGFTINPPDIRRETSMRWEHQC